MIPPTYKPKKKFMQLAIAEAKRDRDRGDYAIGAVITQLIGNREVVIASACFFHANPDSAKALGQIGGRKNRRSAVELRVPDNMTAADVCKVTGQSIRLLLSGELRAREASALAQLCNSLYRVIPTTELEARVTMLEEQVAQEVSGTLPGPDSTGSPTDGTEAAGTDARLEAEQQIPSSIDAVTSTWTHREGEAESTTNGDGEAGKA